MSAGTRHIFFSVERHKQWSGGTKKYVHVETGEIVEANCALELIDGYPGTRMPDGSVFRPDDHETFKYIGQIGGRAYHLMPRDAPDTWRPMRTIRLPLRYRVWGSYDLDN